MKIRTITGAVLGAVFVLPCVFSEYIVYPIVLSLLCVMAAFEMLRTQGLHKRPTLAVPSYALALAMPQGAFFARKLDTGHRAYYLIMALALTVFLVYLLVVFLKDIIIVTIKIYTICVGINCMSVKVV